MYEDVIGDDIRRIEILHNGYDGNWVESRICDLKPAFLFRYCDNRDVVYRAECAPFRSLEDINKWAIFASVVDKEKYFGEK